MNITLTPAMDALVQSKIASGQHTSPAEVIEDALRLLEDQEHLRARELAAFQEELQRRIDSLDRGEGIPAEEIQRHFREKSAKRRQQAA